MAVNIIEGDLALIEQKTVSRYDRNAQTQKFSDEILNDSKISRIIYARLSNLEDMRNISDGSFLQEDIVPEKLESLAMYVQDRQNEFTEFMMQLSDLYDTGEDKDNILEIDKYLGSLGLTETYPFIDDSYTISPWINIIEQDDFRNVFHEDPDTEEIFNVIHFNNSGEKENVIHIVT